MTVLSPRYAAGGTARHAASGLLVHLTEVVGPREQVPMFLYRGRFAHDGHETQFGEMELVPASDPLAIASADLYESAERAKGANDEMRVAIMGLVEDACSQFTTASDVLKYVAQELRRDSEIAGAVATHLNAERDHKAASEGFLKAAHRAQAGCANCKDILGQDESGLQCESCGRGLDRQSAAQAEQAQIDAHIAQMEREADERADAIEAERDERYASGEGY